MIRKHRLDVLIELLVHTISWHRINSGHVMLRPVPFVSQLNCTSSQESIQFYCKNALCFSSFRTALSVFISVPIANTFVISLNCKSAYGIHLHL
ncbi:hypothetical protein VN97_g8308 [Penicillium thymicola]|uniref:Uncharacterized protein n=1 Tax=Penicillium thymicola TaxID=293382 RepID=A0AAI9TE09_PENTH|nr:hypothetical protein VN97_g8308 [Penicillium thymicola]